MKPRRNVLRRRTASATGFRGLGFTLLEMLVALAILGIVASLALPAWSAYTTEARQSAALMRLNAISLALEQYHLQFRTYATDLRTLRAPERDPDFRYTLEAAHRDAYRVEARSLDDDAMTQVIRLDSLGRVSHQVRGETVWRSGPP